MKAKVILSEGARATLARLQTMPAWGLKAVAVGLKKENQLTIGHIQKEHLTGKGPFPPEEHKLGVRSGRLRSALWASEPVVSGQVVESAIGDNVVYAAIHEFGGRIVRKPYSGSVRLRADKEGNLIRQSSIPRELTRKYHDRLAVFAKKSHKQVKTVFFESKGYTIEMPERAPVRTGIKERMSAYGVGIARELERAWSSEGRD